ncbi:MAG: tyrosine-type recombinase/integrase [Gammaproteobacteria bacterium]
MAIAKLRPAQLRSLKPGKYCDGGGLWVYVKPNGNAYWVMRYRLRGRNREMGLGPVRDIPAAKAREAATKYRNIKRDQRDPLHERAKERNASVLLFRDAATRMIEAKRAEWRNSKHAAQWSATLKTYAFPVIGDLPVDAITTDQILKILEPIWRTKTETATRLRQRIEVVLDWSTARKYRHGENPARWRGHLDKLLAKPTKVKKVHHHAALPYAELPAFMEKLAKQGGLASRALAFTILTAARTGEVIGAHKTEIKDGIWIVPPERMKANREHRVPLSTQASAIIDGLPHFENNDYLFAGQRSDQPFSNSAMAAVLKRMGLDDMTVHGFRSSFRDWCAEQTNFPRELAESALAHTLRDKTEAAYQRGDLLQKRARLMQAWADYCTSPNKKGDVVPIRRKA